VKERLMLVFPELLSARDLLRIASVLQIESILTVVT
jgi:hypothetical protein